MQHLSSKKVISVAVLIFGAYSVNGYCQQTGSSQITCFKSQLKNPYSFLGMSGENLELTDGTNWKVTGSNYSPVSSSGGAVLICPELGKMFTLNSALSIEKSAKKPW
jgi:hypothetical protein